MNTFPTLSRSPNVEGYTVSRDANAVDIGSTESGYPVLNKLSTFAPQSWRHTLDGVSQTDKDSIDTFYEANKDVPFYWPCAQDSTTYEVAFIKPPVPILQGRSEGRWIWRITMELMQTAT